MLKNVSGQVNYMYMYMYVPIHILYMYMTFYTSILVHVQYPSDAKYKAKTFHMWGNTSL